MIVKINNKGYNVQVVKEEKELEQGLKGVKSFLKMVVCVGFNGAKSGCCRR